MLVGLQGSGKTTTAPSWRCSLRKQGQNPLLVAADVYRPAAIHQLQTLGKQLNMPVYSEGTQANPVDIAEHALRQRRASTATAPSSSTPPAACISTRRMMHELVQIKARVQPDRSPAGGRRHDRPGRGARGRRVQRAGRHHRPDHDQVDGDARGGAALSVRAVTGVPIKFMGTGEKTDALEPFYPDRLASRILGMGDVMTLIERAQAEYDEDAGQGDGEEAPHGHLRPGGLPQPAAAWSRSSARCSRCWR